MTTLKLIFWIVLTNVQDLHSKLMKKSEIHLNHKLLSTDPLLKIWMINIQQLQQIWLNRRLTKTRQLEFKSWNRCRYWLCYWKINLKIILGIWLSIYFCRLMKIIKIFSHIHYRSSNQDLDILVQIHLNNCQQLLQNNKKILTSF